ncbi:hypothetical protein MNBD_ALPHA03-1166 [hydrothermal vent metagenome]|uniref:Uncharacterized protein n=1 Tax=hydrothermal vent metagenome TaxID=652676 RepID=A0A3B1AX30_9ZZZZ
MNSGIIKHTIYVTLCFFCILSSADAVRAEKIDECFFQAHLTNPAKFGPVYRFERKMFWDTGISYFDGDILYFPIIRSSVIFFGGTCPQADIWAKKLSPIFTIKTISKEQYTEKYNKSNRQFEFIPAGPEPLY